MTVIPVQKEAKLPLVAISGKTKWLLRQEADPVGFPRGGKWGVRRASGAERVDEVLNQEPVGAGVERTVRQGREILRPAIDLQSDSLRPEDNLRGRHSGRFC